MSVPYRHLGRDGACVYKMFPTIFFWFFFLLFFFHREKKWWKMSDPNGRHFPQRMGFFYARILTGLKRKKKWPDSALSHKNETVKKDGWFSFTSIMCLRVSRSVGTQTLTGIVPEWRERERERVAGVIFSSCTSVGAFFSFLCVYQERNGRR